MGANNSGHASLAASLIINYAWRPYIDIYICTYKQEPVGHNVARQKNPRSNCHYGGQIYRQTCVPISRAALRLKVHMKHFQKTWSLFVIVSELD